MTQSPHQPTIKIAFIALASALSLMACQDNHEQPNGTPDVSSGEAKPVINLAGCYTINQGEPAQIKINQDGDNFTMQMKEPKGKASIWDKPEPLQVLNTQAGWDYFKVNTLDLHKSDVAYIIARADGMMALAQVKDSAKNINPRLDSSHVMYIVQGSNTVYQVPCDDTPLDMGNVGIK